VLSNHFPAGEAQPILIVTDSGEAEAVLTAARDVEGIVRATPVGTTEDEKLTKILVTSEYAPSTGESLAQITDLRDAVHDVPRARAVVGGAVATDLDARAGNLADLGVVVPLVLAVSFLVLAFLLRSLVAPLLLLAVNVASAVAAIGAGAWLSRVLFGQHALDLPVPLLAFLFLVALGIDYTIFLVHRARNEAVLPTISTKRRCGAPGTAWSKRSPTPAASSRAPGSSSPPCSRRSASCRWSPSGSSG